ncbi:MAG: ATP-dependent DNA ligase, partial [Gemmatimonadota bacterium]
IPDRDDLWFEPKWDGFRCLAFRDHSTVALQSKAGKPLTRYFPEAAAAVQEVGARRFVLDCELLVPRGEDVAFDLLLQRIHPAESRVRRLAEETPAWLVVFDLLARGSTLPLLDRSLAERRDRLEDFAARFLADAPRIHVTPATEDPRRARAWLDELAGVDGVMAKDPRRAYASGSRDAMWKVKRRRTADCVVGGFRYGKHGGLGSLLLGLHDDAGLLHHVGFCSSFSAGDRVRLLDVVEPLVEEPGFTGRRPGGPSRWSTDRSARWEPLRTELVVEVAYDHFTDGRFRHGTTLERWRPDKEPRQCTLDQVEREGRGALRVLERP